MTWKYVNPGDYRLLDNATASTSGNGTSSSYAPQTGIYFYNNKTANLIDIPAGTKEIYCKFDFRHDRSNFNNNGGVMFSNYGITHDYDTLYANFNGSGTNIKSGFGYAFCTVWMHIVSDATDGLLEVYVDGEQKFKRTGAVNSGNDLALSYMGCDTTTNDKFSNVIIQDYELPKSENIAMLTPTIEDSTGWSESGGTYTANSADQTLWQSFDLSDIAAQTITSFGVYPAVSFGDTSIADAIKLKARAGSSGSGTAVEISNGKFSPVLTNPVAGRAWQKSDFANLQIGLETIKT